MLSCLLLLQMVVECSASEVPGTEYIGQSRSRRPLPLKESLLQGVDEVTCLSLSITQMHAWVTLAENDTFVRFLGNLIGAPSMSYHMADMGVIPMVVGFTATPTGPALVTQSRPSFS